MYTLSELVHKFRHDQDDVVEPYLWSDEEVWGYLDEAEREFCQLSNAIPDDVEITYTANDATIAIPEYVTRIRNGDNDNGEYLSLFNDEEIEDFYTWLDTDYGAERFSASWKTDTGAYPTALITDVTLQTAQLYPIPTIDGAVRLRIFRLPLTRMTDGDQEPEITNEDWQRIYMYKARSLAYEKHDAETYDAQMAEKLEAQFLAKCHTFNVRNRRARRRSKAVSYGGY